MEIGPPVKRLKLSAESKRSIDNLPNELLFKIFLFFDLEDLIEIIAFVCKRWNGVVNSLDFLEALFRRECGSDNVDLFLRQNGSFSRLKTCLAENEVCKGGLCTTSYEPRNWRGYNLKSADKIIEMLEKIDPLGLWEFTPYTCIGTSMSRYYWKEGHLDHIWLFNLQELLSPVGSELITTLQMPFAILGKHHLVLLFDAQLKVLSEVFRGWKDFREATILLQVPVETLYILVLSHDSTIRVQVLFPTLADRIDEDSESSYFDSEDDFYTQQLREDREKIAFMRAINGW